MATIAKWGNSLALRIPQRLAVSLSVFEGTHVELFESEGTLVVAPTKPKYKLDDLLARVTPDDRSEETDWGKPSGKEVW